MKAIFIAGYVLVPLIALISIYFPFGVQLFPLIYSSNASYLDGSVNTVILFIGNTIH